ncbi:hypothetical protein [Amycolatopsis decaplanina]|uniref:Uncharacterized protein n=1 Tax=Amycolatopsis decaplanina DSM 44594 TaxID=1284240 RepID=M2YBX2_9PSEU|nr:hypothetical protein [Amycolatopsis decaplanina]EME52372.1 hypothetical protein H074_32734 [Amycolatopsis decaplanina DSM 44594]
MTMTIPGEQQLVFEAADATEFRALLGRILDTSPLSCGQIAIKTGMPRSTAYSLPDTKRPGLPSNPDQVAAFVRACGLTPTQVDLVMDLWKKLHRATENTRISSGEGKDKSTTEQATPEAIRELLSQAADSKIVLDTSVLAWEPRRHDCDAAPGGRQLFRQGTSWTELLHYILGDERRTRHAVMLLIPVTLLLLGVVCALVFLAVKMPAATPMVVAGLLSPLLLVLRKSGRKPKKKADD